MFHKNEPTYGVDRCNTDIILECISNDKGIDMLSQTYKKYSFTESYIGTSIIYYPFDVSHVLNKHKIAHKSGAWKYKRGLTDMVSIY